MSFLDSYYEFRYWPGDGSVYTGWTIRDTGTMYVGQSASDITGATIQITSETPYGVDLADWYHAQGYDGSGYEDGVAYFTTYTPSNGFSTAVQTYVTDLIHKFESNLAADWLVR